jgi:hypothetical protein
MDPTPEQPSTDPASQARFAEVLRQCESTYWKRTGMPLVLRRLESGDFDKNEMRVILHLIRLGCRPWSYVQVSATKIGKALGMQTVKVGTVLRGLVRRGVVAEEWRLRHPGVGTVRVWRVFVPDTWDRPPATVSEEDTGTLWVIGDARQSALLEMAQELVDAAPGQRHYIWDGPKITNVIAEPSTYPAWMGTGKSHRTRQYADRLIELLMYLLHGGRPTFGKKAREKGKILKWLIARADERVARHPDRY